MKKKSGYIYVITNKAMPGIVKIGYSTDVNKRMNTLYSSNVPFPFEVYATLEGVTDDADKLIHKMLPRSLRVNDSREFFNITPEYAYDVMFQIAKVFGATGKLRKWDEDTHEDGEKTPTKRSGQTPVHANRTNFWDNFNKINKSMGSPLKEISDKGKPYHWQYFPLSGSDAHVEVILDGQKHEVSILYFTHSKTIYQKMNSMTPQFENLCGTKLTWRIRNTKAAFTAMLTRVVPGLDFDNTSNYPTLIKDVIETVVKMKVAYQRLGFSKK